MPISISLLFLSLSLPLPPGRPSIHPARTTSIGYKSHDRKKYKFDVIDLLRVFIARWYWSMYKHYYHATCPFGMTYFPTADIWCRDLKPYQPNEMKRNDVNRIQMQFYDKYAAFPTIGSILCCLFLAASKQIKWNTSIVDDNDDSNNNNRQSSTTSSLAQAFLFYDNSLFCRFVDICLLR